MKNNYPTQQRKQSGFTLLEMLLSVSLIIFIAGIGIPIYQSFQVRNDLDIAVVTLAHSLRRAKLLSQATEYPEKSGIHVQSGNIVLFFGNSYATRDTGKDISLPISPTIVFSGMTEIVFSRMTGFPESTGTMTLTSIQQQSHTITINEKGMVEY